MGDIKWKEVEKIERVRLEIGLLTDDHGQIGAECELRPFLGEGESYNSLNVKVLYLGLMDAPKLFSL
ncbi:hypothetical protein [Bartonella tribocorum]|uniref:Uncharacterized protein n=1 Tax=Bartonella tribocorum TaxID=85701 RepID=A0A2M6UW30_9HYPH|nr:hypothetical protein [Bartonella tribocorum]PIT70405.1 hypothetical protein CEV08_04270 [Bartonella tribocorum]